MSDEPVVVARFTWRHEAEFAVATLEAAGIEALLLADDAGGAYAGLSLSGGVRVLVRASDADRARAFLDGAENADAPEDAAEE